MATKAKAYNPITHDGVQSLVVNVPDWADLYTVVLHTAKATNDRLRQVIQQWTKYTDNIEVAYYGYDCRVLDDDGVTIGTDGYPDAMGVYNPKTETFNWERA
jgi:hypothetical protein